MEIVDSTWTTFTIAGLVFAAGALLVAQLITTKERRLIASTAILLAGVFFAMRPGSPPPLVAVGIGCWVLGLLAFAREVLSWRAVHASRVGPLAVVLLLPPALLGAIVGVGALLSALVAPARLAIRLLGA